MKIKAFHPRLTSRRSYLTSKASSGQKDLVVLNASNYSADDFVVIGNPKEEGTEIGKVASVSGNTITLAANLSESHGQNDAVTVIDYDQVELWKASSETGAYAKVTGTIVDLAIDDEFTLLEDSTGITTDYFKIKYYNTATASYSGFSDSIGDSGYTRYALASIQDHALDLANDANEKRVTRKMITEWVNEWKDVLVGNIMESNEKYFLVKREYTLINGTQEYDFEGRIRKIQKIDVNLAGGSYYRSTLEDIEDDRPDFNYSASDPRHYFNGQTIGFRPAPSSDSAIARIWQEEQPADLSEDGDELSVPMRYYLVNLYDFLEYHIFKQLRKQSASDSAWAKFERGIDGIIEEINDRELDQNGGVKEEDNEFIIT